MYCVRRFGNTDDDFSDELTTKIEGEEIAEFDWDGVFWISETIILAGFTSLYIKTLTPLTHL